MEKNVLIFPEIAEILGKRPYEPRDNFKRFLSEIEKGEKLDLEIQ